jgi:hypothetical protein
MPNEQEQGDFGINTQPPPPRVPERRDRSVIQLNSGCLAPVAGMLLLAVTSGGIGAFLMDKYSPRADNSNDNALVPPTATITPLTVRVRDMHPTDRQEFYSAKYYVEKDAVYEHKVKVPLTGKEVTVSTSSVEIKATARCTAGINHKKKEPVYIIDEEMVEAELGGTEVFGCYEQIVRFDDEKGWLSFPEEERNRLLAEIHGELVLEAQKDGLADKAAEHAKLRTEWQLFKLGFRDPRVRLIDNPPPEEQIEVRPSPSPSPARR